MNEQMKWYIKQALEKYHHPQIVIDEMYSIDEWIEDILEMPKDFGDVLIRALELAVHDVG